MIVVMIIPKSIEPGTLITYNTIVTTNPMIATKAVAFVRLKFTKPIIVPVEDEAIPALASPINAINNPIPTETAFLRLSGIDFTIASLFVVATLD